MPSNNNRKKIKVFGFHPLAFLSLCGILFFNIYCLREWPSKSQNLYHPMLTPLFLIMVLGFGLNFIGSQIPILNKLGLGFLLCIFIPSYLVYKGWIPFQLANNFDKGFFNKADSKYGVGMNFSQFFITIVISGSLLSVDKNLLKRSLFKFIPLTILAVCTCFLVIGFLGALLQYKCPGIFQNRSQGSFLDSIFFIGVPLTNGGTNLGINGFANGLYKEAFPTSSPSDIRSFILAPLILARILSIFLAGLLYVFFDKTKLSGKGSLEKNNAINSTNKQQQQKYSTENKKIGMGLTIIFALYALGSMINQLLYGKMDAMVYVILILLIIKIFDLFSSEYQNCVEQAGKFMTENFTSAILVGLGLTTNFNQLQKIMTDKNILLIVMFSLLTAITITFLLSRKLGFYPLETALTSGICSHSIGGTGNVGVMAISHRLSLLPFAMIATRIVGPLVYVGASIIFRSIYM
ncbi:2-hydroxycarboxylate transporter family protein [Candidatus Phytoplasma melaleucae]|uniref:2-hydroxycarboxylate transporter family protein n=1 Tax=Candidatus Phytoplasma melaleucae TaxID=2982630 RepID=A0ABT9DCY6_9MOLU|nr:2-hydroxycarboxylate transporter family protein ['Melaleuca sp.' phytoplasma]MDO8167955.1 2-hydroxycarboxylate transporter family protein ['Melaleuca sp.' phytoplasma]MDV3205409.1 2-hydroxycarboxylate transporter family protein [Weeping tea tree witches'-broom phytoplasma]